MAAPSEVSQVEILDEQSRGQGFQRRRELIVGLILVLLIGGWASWDWLVQQNGYGHYRAAQAAAGEFDWDRALVEYRAAGYYKDAAQQAAETARLIERREQNYVIAYNAAGRLQWPQALEAARIVESIQPGYRGAASILAQAEQQIFPQALDGAVVRRTQADPPGLYIYRDGSWRWLRGSDSRSRVLGAGDLCCVIYDGPRPRREGDEVEERIMNLARLDAADLSVKALALFPEFCRWYTWGRAGMWGTGCGVSDDPSFSPPDRTYHSVGYDQGDVMYQPFDSEAAGRVWMPGGKFGVLDFGRDGKHMLIYQLARPDPNKVLTNLYIAEGLGLNPRLISSQSGQPYQARLSPDGNLALYSFKIDNAGVVRDAVVLVDLTTGESTELFAQAAGDELWGIRPGALFLPLDGRNLVALVADERSNSGAIAILSPPAGPELSGPTWTLRGADHAWARVARDGKRALVGQNGPENFSLLYLSTYGAVRIEPPLEQGEGYGTASVEGDYLLYESVLIPSASQASITLNSMHLSQQLAGRTELFTLPANTRDAWSLGPAMAAYIAEDSLWARGYDGTDKVLIEQGVTAIFDLRTQSTIDWLR